MEPSQKSPGIENINPLPVVEKLHDGSRVCGVLYTICSEEDYRIARIGRRRFVLPSEPDLTGFMGQKIVLTMDRERCLVRLAGYDIEGVEA